MGPRSDHPPNLLLVGAARSGTTALASDLSAHPEVTFTEPKETNFFAYANENPVFTGPGDEEMITRSIVVDPRHFDEILAAGRHGRVRGEGSVSTLYLHETSIPNIHEYAAPDARILMVLRDPVERAFSNYLYLRSRGYEDAPDFPTALALEDERVERGWHHIWHYRRLSHYGGQLGAFLASFGPDRVFVALHDDYRADPCRFLGRIFDFLELDPVGIDSSKRGEVNVGGVPRSRTVQRLTQSIRRSPRAARLAKAAVPFRTREWVRSRSVQRPELPTSLRRDMTGIFGADVAALEDHLHRSLDSWRE